KIICVSQKTREDLKARFDVAEEKLAVVYHGADHVNAVPAPDATSLAFVQSLALPEQLVLYAGALDSRKNVAVLIAAASRLRAGGQPITLVLAGQDWYGSDEVAARVSRARKDGTDIRSLGYQDESVFYALMRRATVFAFPSRYEGFGLPPLEAMRLGIPTVVSPAGGPPGVCGDGARVGAARR